MSPRENVAGISKTIFHFDKCQNCPGLVTRFAGNRRVEKLMNKPRETDLYDPVKAYLEGQGYEVKGEVGALDVMAVRGDEPPLVVELKLGFTLALVHQAIERIKISDLVYVAVPRGKTRAQYKALLANRKLCRMLGVGFMTVRLDTGLVEVHQDPGPYAPRKSKIHKTQLLSEFERRVGDPNKGGTTRRTIVTAYRQDAARVAEFLSQNGASKGAIVAKDTGVARATRIMADDHYGWFERAEKGIYQLTDKGVAALGEVELDDAVLKAEN